MSSRRISAGELEDRYIIKHALFDFYMEMLDELIMHAEDKGLSWRACKKSALLIALKKHVKDKDWVGVANFAFFLAEIEKQRV